MAKLLASIGVLVWGEEGATLGEYCVTLLLIVFVTVAAISALGSSLSKLFSDVASSI